MTAFSSSAMRAFSALFSFSSSAIRTSRTATLLLSRSFSLRRDSMMVLLSSPRRPLAVESSFSSSSSARSWSSSSLAVESSSSSSPAPNAPPSSGSISSYFCPSDPLRGLRPFWFLPYTYSTLCADGLCSSPSFCSSRHAFTLPRIGISLSKAARVSRSSPSFSPSPYCSRKTEKAGICPTFTRARTAGA
jgi:hypothetical protein